MLFRSEDIDFQIDLLSTDRIDVQYIVNLVKAINLDNKDSRQADVNKIKRLLIRQQLMN